MAIELVRRDGRRQDRRWRRLRAGRAESRAGVPAQRTRVDLFASDAGRGSGMFARGAQDGVVRELNRRGASSADNC